MEMVKEPGVRLSARISHWEEVQVRISSRKVLILQIMGFVLWTNLKRKQKKWTKSDQQIQKWIYRWYQSIYVSSEEKDKINQQEFCPQNKSAKNRNKIQSVKMVKFSLVKFFTSIVVSQNQGIF